MPSLEPRGADLRDLAAAHLARTVADDAYAAALEPGREARPGLRDLLLHAGRDAGAPVSLGVERALRADPAAGTRYRRLLAALSVGHSSVALAASSGPATTRVVGPYQVSLHEGGPDVMPALLIAGPMSPRPPQAIEVHQGGEEARLALPAPIGARIALLLDPGRPETSAVERLLRRPTAEIFLV